MLNLCLAAPHVGLTCTALKWHKVEGKNHANTIFHTNFEKKGRNDGRYMARYNIQKYSISVNKRVNAQ